MSKESQPPARKPSIEPSGRDHETNLSIIRGRLISPLTVRLMEQQPSDVVDRMASKMLDPDPNEDNNHVGLGKHGRHSKKAPRSHTLFSIAANPTKGRST